jgi:hypothetical protein
MSDDLKSALVINMFSGYSDQPGWDILHQPAPDTTEMIMVANVAVIPPGGGSRDHLPDQPLLGKDVQVSVDRTQADTG